MPLSLLDPKVLLSLIVGLLIYSGIGGYLVYARGRDDMKAAYTEQQLATANLNIHDLQTNQASAAKAGADHEQNVQTVHDTTREIIHTVQIPAAADPFLPVGFVRLFDRAASRSIVGDPYPGKSDGDPSDVKVSEAASLLAGEGGWADQFYSCRQQVADIVKLKPVMPAPAASKPGLLDSLNPF